MYSGYIFSAMIKFFNFLVLKKQKKNRKPNQWRHLNKKSFITISYLHNIVCWRNFYCFLDTLFLRRWEEFLNFFWKRKRNKKAKAIALFQWQIESLISLQFQHIPHYSIEIVTIVAWISSLPKKFLNFPEKIRKGQHKKIQSTVIIYKTDHSRQFDISSWSFLHFQAKIRNVSTSEAFVDRHEGVAAKNPGKKSWKAIFDDRRIGAWTRNYDEWKPGGGLWR